MGPYSLLDLTNFLAAVTRFDHCSADSEAQPHSASFTGLLGLGHRKYNNILQQLYCLVCIYGTATRWWRHSCTRGLYNPKSHSEQKRPQDYGCTQPFKTKGRRLRWHSWMATGLKWKASVFQGKGHQMVAALAFSPKIELKTRKATREAWRGKSHL